MNNGINNNNKSAKIFVCNRSKELYNNILNF